MLFDDVMSTCPFCFEKISVPIDPGGGNEQEVHIDCEVCCKPILVRASWDEDKEEYRVELDRS
jgi:hypothetical protein